MLGGGARRGRTVLGSSYVLRGEAYRQLGREDEAIEDYTRALFIDPADVQSYVVGLPSPSTRRVVRVLFRRSPALLTWYRKYYT